MESCMDVERITPGRTLWIPLLGPVETPYSRSTTKNTSYQKLRSGFLYNPRSSLSYFYLRQSLWPEHNGHVTQI